MGGRFEYDDENEYEGKWEVALNEVASLSLSQQFHRDVLLPLKQAFVGKDEIVDLMGICLAAGENLFLLGPPGTAKSALVRELARRIDGRVFDYLLTRFTEPNELFGPFDIRRLREGELVTNTEGMLPEASFVFLDELLNANSAILNSLLMVLNERVFRRGRETRSLPLLLVVAASNRLPEEEALTALFDRFLLRVRCDNVPDDKLSEVLVKGWKLDIGSGAEEPKMPLEAMFELQRAIRAIDLTSVQAVYLDTIGRLRRAGIAVSDRRAVKLQRVIAASAVLCGRETANRTDLWVLRHIWDTEEQQEIIAAIVDSVLSQANASEQAAAHPRAQSSQEPNCEELSREIEQLGDRWKTASDEAGRAALRDQLTLLTSRIAWVTQPAARDHLQAQAQALWDVVKSCG